jgi:hypothetical protein
MNDPLFAYLGPETFLPLGTVITVTVGFVLTFGRSVISSMKKALDFFRKR